MAAEVVSQNVVGYQETAATGTFNIVGATFLPPGTDGKTMTLSDIKVNSTFDFGADYISIFNDSGNIILRASYLGKDAASGMGYAEGWYDFDKANAGVVECKNTFVLPFGSSFAFNRATNGAELVFSGEVINEAMEVEGTGSFNLVANATPVPLKLSDIKVNSTLAFGADYITIFNDSGNIIFRASYLGKDAASGMGYAEGWYDFDKANAGVIECKNTFDVPAGFGFAFNKATSGAKVIIPTPIK